MVACLYALPCVSMDIFQRLARIAVLFLTRPMNVDARRCPDVCQQGRAFVCPAGGPFDFSFGMYVLMRDCGVSFVTANGDRVGREIM